MEESDIIFRNEKKGERADMAKTTKDVSNDDAVELERTLKIAEEEMIRLARQSHHSHLTENEKVRRGVFEKTLEPIRDDKEDQRN